MKKIIMIAVMVIVLVAVVGCSAVNTEEDVQESIAQEKVAEHGEAEEHDHSVQIEGSEMKALSVQEVADLWKIEPEVLLSKIIAEFDLQKEYDVDVTLEEIRQAEYKFSPAIIKDLAEEIKNRV
jgi:uncharacterized protein YceK